MLKLSSILWAIFFLASVAHADRFDLDKMPSQEMLEAYPVEKEWYEDLVTARLPYDDAERYLFGYAMALQVADAATTFIALDRGAVEANPLFGEDPNNMAIIVAKAALMASLWMATNYIDDHTARKWLLGLIDVGMTVVIINNVNVISQL